MIVIKDLKCDKLRQFKESWTRLLNDNFYEVSPLSNQSNLILWLLLLDKSGV